MPKPADCHCSCHKPKLPTLLTYLAAGYNPYAYKKHKKKVTSDGSPLSTAPGVVFPTADGSPAPAPTPAPTPTPVNTSPPAAAAPAEPATVTAIQPPEPATATVVQPPEPTSTEQVPIDDPTAENTGFEPEWTVEEDSKLLELKAKNMSWKQIAIDMGNKKDIRDRFKQLMKAKHMSKDKEKEVVVPTENPNSKATQTEGNWKEEGYVTASEESMIDVSGREPPSHETTSKESPPGDTSSGSISTGSWVDDVNEATFSRLPKAKRTWEVIAADFKRRHPEGLWHRPTIMLEDGEEMDEGLLNLLFNLKIYCDEGYWVELASRFWDKTGRRVDPQEIREKLEGEW